MAARNEVVPDDTDTARRAGLETLFAWARPWQYQRLYETLGYEPRQASIDFRGPLQ